MARKKLSDMPVEGSPLDAGALPAGFKKIIGNQLHIDVEKMREHNVFFATPCYGGLVTDQYFLSMFRLQKRLVELGMNFQVTTLRNESLVTRARNILVAMFMSTPCTHLFFIDADIEFEEDSVVRMLAMDKDIIAGAYPKKTLPTNYAINIKVYDPETGKIRVENGAIEVHDASTGFFCIKREVIERMMMEYPELHYKNDASIDPSLQKWCYALFDTWLDSRDNRYLSEDYTFCRRWQALEGEIWLDPNTKLNHIGSYTFEGDVSQIINWNNIDSDKKEEQEE